jgi:hypothetical protein
MPEKRMLEVMAMVLEIMTMVHHAMRLNGGPLL